MSSETVVKLVYPLAESSRPTPKVPLWGVYTNDEDDTLIGEGAIEKLAWENAAYNLSKVLNA